MLYLGWTLILIGIFFVSFGIIALFRFPDFFTKMHGAGVVECCGLPITFIGLACLQENFASSFKLILIAFLILLLSPVATHALGRASLLYKVDKNGRIK